MPDKHTFNRRDFLKLGAAVGTGLVIGVNINGCHDSSPRSQQPGVFTPNAWLQINNDNSVEVYVAESDMGQGVLTAIPMLVAEELDADWSTIKVKLAPMTPVYGYQVTGGSDSIRKAWLPMRQAGAVARAMLVSAAALTWKVPRDDCYTEAGFVIHKTSKRRVNYGELVDMAAKLPIPGTVTLKKPEQFKLLGQPLPRVDNIDKITGAAVYGTDIKIPGLLTAAIKHCPVFGGTLLSVDAVDATPINGVRQVVELESSVAVVATHYWAAQQGLNALKIVWSDSPHQALSSQSIQDELRAAVTRDDKLVINTGDAKSVIRSSQHTVQAMYEIPYQAHATMEPMNCTVHIKEDECDIWVSTQSPSSVQNVAFDRLYSGVGKLFEKLRIHFNGGQQEKIHVHKTAIGGGFGRRFNNDFVREAISIAQEVNAPVKLIWSREEDIQHDYYRPVSFHHLTAALNDQGTPIAWSHQTAGPTGIQAGKIPYEIDNVYSSTSGIDIPVPVGSWRSVKLSYQTFAIESFIDEIAHATNQDPVVLRLRMLNKEPRLRTVIETAAMASGWNRSAAKGHFRGIAAMKGFGSYIAQVAEVSIGSDDNVRVHRIVCAFDCGMIVNPDIIRAQLEGGIIFGLTATLKSAISIADGKVVQSNFHDFPLLRIDETPRIDIHLVQSEESPGGVGEPPVPPVAPAIANAVFAATGKRPRILPISLIDK